jgi:putative ABC transport system substrate-binding protein
VWLRTVKLIVLLTLVLLTAAFAAQAQPLAKAPRIGYLGTGTVSTAGRALAAFQQGLRDLGYVEGQNIVIEYRWAEGQVERLPDLAAEFVRLKVDLIVAPGTLATQAAKQGPAGGKLRQDPARVSRE